MRDKTDDTSVHIDFDADELMAIAKAMKSMNLTLSEFIDKAIKQAVSEAYKSQSPNEGR